MVEPIKLYAFILGLRHDPFPVTVAKSDTVEDLGKAILNEKSNDLRNFDIGQPRFYQVSLADDGNLEQSAPQNLGLRLNIPSRKVSTMFPNTPPEATISIVLDIRSVVGE